MNKWIILLLSLLFDGVGMLSYAFPVIGEVTDVAWAPISAWLMTKMYKGKEGKIAAVVTFIEEAIPSIDIIPTFTLMWIYTYAITKKH